MAKPVITFLQTRNLRISSASEIQSTSLHLQGAIAREAALRS